MTPADRREHQEPFPLPSEASQAAANVSSIAGLVSFGILTSYSGSKAPLHSVTQTTRSWLEAQGTYVAGIYPGPIDTDMGKALDIAKTPPAVAARAPGQNRCPCAVLNDSSPPVKAWWPQAGPP